MSDAPVTWPVWARESWEERAAILEYEAGLDRETAEKTATRMVLERLRKDRERRLFE